MNRKDVVKYPEKKGNIDIFPQIQEGNAISITIIGDPDGLRYMSSLLLKLADYDQEISQAPSGSREHIHLHPGNQLGNHSSEVEICRADAKGTKELPEFMIKENPG